MKLEKLTAKQIERFPEFVKKWNEIGLSTESSNRKEAEDGVRLAYKIAELKAPKIVWCGSPLSQGITRAIVFGLKPSEVKASVGDSVWDSVRDSVRDSVGTSVWASVRDSVGASGYGQHDAGWLSFYDYFRVACELNEQTEKLLGIWKISKNAGWWLPHEKVCWISERHNILNRNAQGRLHCDGGPAVEYPDGWQIFALNGVRVSKEYAVIPAEQISPGTVLNETNAEIRRELLRKIGIERFLSVAKHKVLNKSGNYELLSIHLSDEFPDARYLKMVNPSIGVFHVEGVHPTCKNVQEAINFRAGEFGKQNDWHPEVLT